MKKIKIVLMLLCSLLLTACFNQLTPSEKVEDLLNKYIQNDPSLLEELDTYLDKQDLRQDQREKYGNIIKNEYSTIKYTITDERIEGDSAKVTLTIVVRDLYKSSKEAGEYLLNHSQEFYQNGVYDKEKFIDYKLSLMENGTDTKEYTIEIDLKNRDDNWIILELDNATLEKLHGIYDYDEDAS